jgi:hypothetical protein
MVLGDTAQHPAVFARHPDWQAPSTSTATPP